jgi:hypothetical protein
MAKNITQFFHPSAPNNTVAPADLFHLGRTANPDPAEQDISLTGSEMFDSMNAQVALLGTPSVIADTLVTGVRERLRNYAQGIGIIGTPDAVAGTITIDTTGIYRVTVSLLGSAPSDNGFNIGCFLVWQTANLAISGQSIAARASAGDLINLSGGMLIALTAGDIVELQMEADANVSPITFPNGTFEVVPIFVS